MIAMPHPNNNIDVIVFKYKDKNQKNITPLTEIFFPKGFNISSDVYFLGFPYARYMDSQGLNNGYPFPFVKKGVIAGVKGKEIYIDGHNNNGFSGGPIVQWSEEKKLHGIIGVISGYWSDLKEDEQLTDIMKENSGIFYGFSNEAILEIIKKDA